MEKTKTRVERKSPEISAATSGKAAQSPELTTVSHSTSNIKRQARNCSLMRDLKGPQAKLSVSSPQDREEKEADEMATGIVSGQKMARISRLTPGKGAAPIHRQPSDEDDEEAESAKKEEAIQTLPVIRQVEEDEEEEAVQAKTEGEASEPHTGAASAMEAKIRSPGSGRPLPDTLRTEMEDGLGADFSDVRVHDTAEDGAAAEGLNAKAFAFRNHIWLAPGASAGDRKLMAHELTHVVQQGQAAPAVTKIQRKIVPEDVAVEMIGREFTVAAAFHVSGFFGGSLKPGTRVTVVTWSNASDTVTVFGGGVFKPFSIPKKLLRPVRAKVAGVAPYSAGVGGQAAAVEKSEKELAAWVAKESSFKTAKAVALFKAERKRLEDLLKKRQEILNRHLIQETIFNRFDGLIKKEVDAANKAHGLTGKAALDPNLFKSMLFQETQLGTAGTHLEVPPTHPVKTRFNLGQVIDSSGLALMTLFEKEIPSVMSMFLPGMRIDLLFAQKERVLLKKKPTLTATESARLATLDGLARQNWEVFIWSYKSSTGLKFADFVNAFFSSGKPARNLDYGFWIHLAVMWLFEKRKPGMSWPEVIRAYNGSGAKAKHYRNAVVKRAKGAKAAEKAGKAFIPGKI